MNDALAEKLKYLHLGELLTHWDDYLKLAGDQRFSHGRLLTHIVEEQYRVKRETPPRTPAPKGPRSRTLGH